MGLPIKKNDRVYTYADYRRWPDDERWEIIHGQAWSMSPAPNAQHQRVVTNMARLFLEYFKTGPCEIFIAPFDLFLPETGETEDDQTSTIVQPDLLVVCDPEKIHPNGCHGAPDLVVEILSPWTMKRDYQEKFALYQEMRVPEFWLIDPAGRTACIFDLTDREGYGEGVLSGLDDRRLPDRASSLRFPGLTVPLASMFHNV